MKFLRAHFGAIGLCACSGLLGAGCGDATVHAPPAAAGPAVTADDQSAARTSPLRHRADFHPAMAVPDASSRLQHDLRQPLRGEGNVPLPPIPAKIDPLRSPQDNIELSLNLLNTAQRKMKNCPGYTARLILQEKVNGNLLPAATITLKVRRTPFSVRATWDDSSRDVTYVEGRDNNRIHVKETGFRGLLGIVRLDPRGSLAMREARHAVPDLGIAALTDILIEYRTRDRDLQSGVECQITEDATFADRPCLRLTFEYASPEIEETYRKSVILLDQERQIPVFVHNYGWPEEGQENSPTLDEDTLIEYYAYHDLQLDQRHDDDDFELIDRTRTRAE